MKRGFTMVEMLLSVFLVGVLTALSVLTFNSVTRGWQGSTDYMDKLQRTDFALNQVISGLKSMYYPHDGKQDYDYGFFLTDNGKGEDPDESDIIEWSKTGPAIVGNKNAVADSVHRVQVMILEEGNHDWKDPIEVTGLYARLCPDVALRPKDDEDGEEVDYTFANDEMYQPILVADGVVGFNCRVMKSEDQAKTDDEELKFEDEWEASNTVPYKVQLTFRIADPEGRSYRSNTAPLMRIIRIPIHEQSIDGAQTPGEASGSSSGGGRGGSQGARPGGARQGAQPGAQQGTQPGGFLRQGSGTVGPGGFMRGGGNAPR